MAIVLQESTNYVIGIWSLRAVAFECMSMDDVLRLRSLYSDHTGITPHAGLAVYTRNEWLRGGMAQPVLHLNHAK